MDKVQMKELADSIKAGKVGVLPTDTIYGICASALDRRAVEKVYERTRRPSSKPFITLISHLDQLKHLNIQLNSVQLNALKKVWPGPVSAIFNCPSRIHHYLHRGGNSLAVRLPQTEWLRELITLAGPIIATSANMSGQPTSDIIDEIKVQIPGLDFYVAGPVGSEPSKLVVVDDDGLFQWLERK